MSPGAAGLAPQGRRGEDGAASPSSERTGALRPAAPSTQQIPPAAHESPSTTRSHLSQPFCCRNATVGKSPVPLPQCDGRGHQAGGWHGSSWHPGSIAEPHKTRGPWTHGDKRGGHGSPVRPSSWGPGTPWSNMASKVALTVRCTNATQDAEATMLPLPGHGINATRHRNKTHMEVTAASVTAHPPLAGLAWHALLLGVFSSFA